MDELIFWGKSGRDGQYHPLLYHMLDVAAVCEALPINRSIRDIPPAWVVYLAALHDIGKADPYFQNKDEQQAARLRHDGLIIPERKGRFRHEARSHSWLCDYLMETHKWGRYAANCIGQAMHGHHGNFTSACGVEACDPLARKDYWDPIRERMAYDIADVLGITPWKIERFAHSSATGARLAGLVVLADWIASNETLYPSARYSGEKDPAAYLKATRRIAYDVVRQLGFCDSPSPAVPSIAPAFTAVWPACLTLRPTQQALDALCRTEPPPPGLAIIEAPMGEGKTEAAIYLATVWQQISGLRGAYIALPTAATSNQMHARYAEFLRRQLPNGSAPRLVHGMAWLIDEQTPHGDWSVGEQGDAESARAQDWFRPSKRALLAQHGVGTIDQALKAALHVKHGFLRLCGLADKVLIIDEAHAYDVYMTTILQRLLAWCRALGTPVILLSATLSQAQKRALIAAYAGQDVLSPQHEQVEAYPLLTFVSPQGALRQASVDVTDTITREITVKQHPGLLNDPHGIAQLALRAIAPGGCACVLVNSVKMAQAVYETLRALNPAETELLLFHARFRAERRNEIERAVRDLFGKDTGNAGRPSRAILVATQVVEQSLDVDFDVMISQLAPIDLLLQRAGRLHRHARGRRPTGEAAVMHVLLPTDDDGYDFGSTGKIYQNEPLLRTLALLRNREGFHLPANFRPLIEGCYGADTPPPMDIDPVVFSVAVAEQLHAAHEEESMAEKHLIPLPDHRDFTLAQNPKHTSIEPEEEESQAVNAFLAPTRLGDDTCAALILHDPALYASAQQENVPDRVMLKTLFLQQVNLPAWWLSGVLESNENPPWLRGHHLLLMTENCWRRKDDNGKVRIIRDDPELGLILYNEEIPNGDLPSGD